MRYCLFLYHSWFSLKLMKSEISIWGVWQQGLASVFPTQLGFLIRSILTNNLFSRHLLVFRDAAYAKEIMIQFKLGHKLQNMKSRFWAVFLNGHAQFFVTIGYCAMAMLFEKKKHSPFYLLNQFYLLHKNWHTLNFFSLFILDEFNLWTSFV